MRKCSGCNEEIDNYENTYVCKECSKSYRVCEGCRFSESLGHPHKLTREDGKLRDYSYYNFATPKKGLNGAKLVLGSHSAALPNSAAIREENIKSVLSLLHFDTENPPKDNSPLDTVQKIFFPNGKYQALVRHKGILYFHINVPDLEDPGQLESYGCSDLLARAVFFIEFSLRVGSVLVHCEKGQRRSPTVFLAWLMYHKHSLIQSIDMLAEGYEGDENWGENYKRRRNLWIDGPLDVWSSNNQKICREWVPHHRELIEQWKKALFHKTRTTLPPTKDDEKKLQVKTEKQVKPSTTLTKRSRDEVTEICDENVPANKIPKLTSNSD